MRSVAGGESSVGGVHRLQGAIDALPPTDEWGVEAAQLLLVTADQLRASDLHLQSCREGVRVRLRCDGELIPAALVPPERRDLLLARFKVMAKLPAFVRTEPQDGRIDWRRDSASAPKTLRISFLPTIHGEAMVVRFPEASARPMDLEALGMPQDVADEVRAALLAPEGTILCTGPSGSGKTTTLYALLRHLHERRGDQLHIVTIEDPVESDLGFASQVQVNEAQGLTFDRALRSALRQDPNVLLVGEIRDSETARIAVQAGMTGHLVLSTLHAGRACKVFTRLLSIGVEPYLVASALSGVMAQRLVRLRDDGGAIRRTGLFEFVPVHEDLRELILARATPARIAEQAVRLQRGDLADEARSLATQGLLVDSPEALALAVEEAHVR